MRIPLLVSPSLSFLAPAAASTVPSPVAFINEEPFIIELQGSLELPGGGTDGNEGGMSGVSVGVVEFVEPNKPILTIAHHRLEGRLVTLVEPYALLKSTPRPSSSLLSPRASKRARHSSPPSTSLLPLPSSSTGKPLRHHPTSSPEKPSMLTDSDRSMEEQEASAPTIEIVALVRRKIVFSKRPEPVVVLHVNEESEAENEEEVGKDA